MKSIIHADMDQFFAAVEIRDNPELLGKPLIVGALPDERGVVSTCSYEARAYGVRSAMSIKEAYRLCPNGIYMHPDLHKYQEASAEVHKIWARYSDLIEYIALDEAFIDVSGSAHLFGGAVSIGQEIKHEVKRKTGLTCSVGIGYSLMSAKLASEEKKPDGFFQILTPQALKDLIIDRDVRIIYGVGVKTAGELKKIGINTVRDIYLNKDTVKGLLGEHGRQIVDLAEGIDGRSVEAYTKAKSIGSEYTFQQDITDRSYLRDVLRLTARKLAFQLKTQDIFCRTVTLKATYKDMKKISRSQSGDTTNRADIIYKTAEDLFNKIERKPIRLIGISLSNLSGTAFKQLTLSDESKNERLEKLDCALTNLQKSFGFDIIKTASDLIAEHNLEEEH